jgi:hypothetical protein
VKIAKMPTSPLYIRRSPVRRATIYDEYHKHHPAYGPCFRVRSMTLDSQQGCCMTDSSYSENINIELMIRCHSFDQSF